MDEQIHRYELDIKGMMSQLEELLAQRGYRTIDQGNSEIWMFETHWGRGAAYGEIGSMLYGLVADTLREIEPNSDAPLSPSS